MKTLKMNSVLLSVIVSGAVGFSAACGTEDGPVAPGGTESPSSGELVAEARVESDKLVVSILKGQSGEELTTYTMDHFGAPDAAGLQRQLREAETTFLQEYTLQHSKDSALTDEVTTQAYYSGGFCYLTCAVTVYRTMTTCGWYWYQAGWRWECRNQIVYTSNTGNASYPGTPSSCTSSAYLAARAVDFANAANVSPYKVQWGSQNCNNR